MHAAIAGSRRSAEASVSDLPKASADSEANLEKAIRLYTELGFTAERIAAQLIRSGYPTEWVRQRFLSSPFR